MAFRAASVADRALTSTSQADADADSRNDVAKDS